jgi:hypothetical protein
MLSNFPTTIPYNELRILSKVKSTRNARKENLNLLLFFSRS